MTIFGRSLLHNFSVLYSKFVASFRYVYNCPAGDKSCPKTEIVHCLMSHVSFCLQEDELARPIPENQVLGIRDFQNGEDIEDEDAQDDDEQLEASQVLGAAKRVFIMENVLPNDDE